MVLTHMQRANLWVLGIWGVSVALAAYFTFTGGTP